MPQRKQIPHRMLLHFSQRQLLCLQQQLLQLLCVDQLQVQMSRGIGTLMLARTAITALNMEGRVWQSLAGHAASGLVRLSQQMLNIKGVVNGVVIVLKKDTK